MTMANYEPQLKRALELVLAKNEQLQARLAALESDLAKARGGNGEIGVVKHARKPSPEIGGKVVGAPRGIPSGVKKASQAKGETGIFERAIKEGQVQG